jgi:S-adenosylmethionine synthetase
MFEKVNPSHPDKVADRIAGAIVDMAYAKCDNPKVACEVLIGHGECNIQVETSEQLTKDDIEKVVNRIAGKGFVTRAIIVPQDTYLAANQEHGVRCGDNGIFKGVPPTHEQNLLTDVVADIYKVFPYDGKYTIHIPQGEKFAEITVCQSHVFTDRDTEDLLVAAWGNNRNEDPIFKGIWNINPIGPWTGGPNTDSGATNRKLGSDMGDGVTGGGLHGKDLSKADVSINIWCYLEAVRTGKAVTAICSIGDEMVNGIPYSDIVEQARQYIQSLGGFEKFAEWGLIRPKSDYTKTNRNYDKGREIHTRLHKSL